MLKLIFEVKTMTTTAAPGGPGISARWTSSAKIGVGTGINHACNLWFTLSHGIVNEVYWPRIDVANTRDMGLIVTDGRAFFSEEKRDADHDYETLGDGIPAYHLINTCKHQHYRIEKRIITDPHRAVLLQEIEFVPLKGSMDDYKLFLLLAPHIRNRGMDNTGWAGDYKGHPTLFAKSELSPGLNLACACNVPFKQMTVGYVGVNDAWRDLKDNKIFTQIHHLAENGNIALAAEIDLQACQGKCVVSLSFGVTPFEAGLQSRSSLIIPFQYHLEEYVSDWENYQKEFDGFEKIDPEGGKLFRISTAVLKVHEGKRLSGSIIASLSIPWGNSKGDNNIGGYHLVWPRDQVQTAIAMVAASKTCAVHAQKVLHFLMSTQEADGHWAQCMWEDGTPYWPGLQMDETALPILLADILLYQDALQGLDPFEMIRKAAINIIKNGPVTQEDRWEEEAGYTPFTLAVGIAALLTAAEWLANGDLNAAEYLRETADWWNESIERWLYVKNTDLCKQCDVEGYYARVLPSERLQDAPPRSPEITLTNLHSDKNRAHYADIVSVDALALVRYGLRNPDDPRILNTVKVIDQILKSETVRGPIWHRYNRDGYGEHEDGSPYDGTGVGRGWPLLCGERAHYELAAGNKEKALELLKVMANYAGVGGLIPEQIWDSTDIPEKSLFNGHSAGAPKPLVWAHAEYITLLKSLKDGAIFGMPFHTRQRYLFDRVRPQYALWKFNHQLPFWPVGKKLRIQTEAPGFIHWTSDNWQTTFNLPLVPVSSLELYFTDLPVETLPLNSEVIFTFFWETEQKWEGNNFSSVAREL